MRKIGLHGRAKWNKNRHYYKDFAMRFDYINDLKVPRDRVRRIQPQIYLASDSNDSVTFIYKNLVHLFGLLSFLLLGQTFDLLFIEYLSEYHFYDR